MNDEPPNIPSDGTGPTAFGDGRFGPGIASSGGGATRFDDMIGEFADAGIELPPELLDEQRAVFLRPGDVVGGRFEVVKPLGFGGMGAVYHVKDRHLHLEDKALKVMLPSLLRSETAQERFRSEVGISQKLRHESIVTVFDLAEDADRGIRFFTMEYVPGVTLHRYLKDKGGRLEVDEALDIARQICDALEYAHRYTIHRDLKPQNIMVRSDGRIKMLDFGLAKLMSPGRLTKSSMALGTAYYQAPEQSVRLAELDARADLYSLGVILYQMLTSRIPLGMSKPPSQLVRNLPRALDAVVSRCLEPEPEDRYASAAAVRAALGEAVSHRRRPWVYAAVAVLAIAAVAAAWLAFAPGGEIGRIGRIGQIGLEPEAATPPPTPAPATPAPPTPAEEPAAAKTAPQPREARTFAGIEMVWIPPGEFMMGSPESEEGRYSDEGPQHRVTIARGFWLGKYEVTKAQWRAAMNSEPWAGKPYVLDDPNSPAVYVSWDDAQAFCRKLGAGFRLPSEAEWEYACRAGSSGKYCLGDDDSRLGEFAWYSANVWDVGEKYDHVVGQKRPNKWGLYDMHGNACEWCQDWYHDSYNGAPTDGSAWESRANKSRVLRGGSWFNEPGVCRSARRSYDFSPADRNPYQGFRSLRTP